MRFSQEFIERVQEANSLVDVVSQFTQLKPMSGGYMGRCPFPSHPEKSPSFSVSETKQVYHCFGCHKSGNLFTFLKEYHGMSYPEAIEYLAQRANIPLPISSAEEMGKQDQIALRRKELIKINTLALQFFHENFLKLPDQHPCKIYVRDRGLNEKTIKTFKIGFVSDEWDSLNKFLNSKNVPAQLRLEARLVKEKGDSRDQFYDFFRSRLMFPILNPLGDPIAFGGRIIGSGDPKYLNSQETPVFSKGKTLYGLSESARFIRSEDQALVVEGYMDLVSLFQAGFQNGIAVMSTTLTSDHARALGRITKNIIMLLDGDLAGMDGALKSLPILLAANLHPKVVALPEGLDPDDYLKKEGVEPLKKLILEAKDLFSFVLNRGMKSYRGEASEKIQICDLMKPIFKSIQDVRLKQLYLIEMAKKMTVTPNWLSQALSQESNSRPYPQSLNQNSQVVQQSNKSFASEKSENFEKMETSEKIEKSDEKQGRIEQKEPLILLKTANKVELTLLQLVLKKRSLMTIYLNLQIQDQILHTGVKNLLDKVTIVYRQNPEKFDKLVSQLASSVDDPSLLMSFDLDKMSHQNLNQNSEKNDGESLLAEVDVIDEKLLIDCIKRIRENNFKLQAKKIAKEISLSQVSPEKLNEYMALHKNRLSLNKEP